MTEPENFEDDLFADLYNDDEPGKTAPVSQPEPAAPSAPAAAEPTQIDYGTGHNEPTQVADYGAGEDSHMNGGEEYEDDDDEVDFNLGNENSHHAETPTYDNRNPAPGPYGHKGPNSKEDG